MRTPVDLYILHALPGFDAIVAEELKRLPEKAVIQDQLVHAGRNGMIIISYPGDVEDLMEDLNAALMHC